MIYTILAVICFISAVSLTIYKLGTRSLSVAKYMGKSCVIENRPILCNVEKTSWISEDEGALHCILPESKERIIIPYILKAKAIPKKVWLIKTKTKEGVVFYLSKTNYSEDTEFDFKDKTTEDIISLEDADKKNLIINILYAINGILLILSLLLIAAAPLISITMCLIGCMIVFGNVPFKHWTNIQSCCIIKATKEPSVITKKPINGNDDNKKVLPVGYNEWSDTEKELFDIDMRLKDFLFPDEDSLLVEDGIDVNKKVTIPKLEPAIPSPDSSRQKKDSSFNICKNCGCVIEADVAFCAHCGGRLKDPIVNNSLAPPSEVTTKLIDPLTEISDEPYNKGFQVVNPQSRQESPPSNKKKNHRYRSKQNSNQKRPSEIGNIIEAAENSLF